MATQTEVFRADLKFKITGLVGTKTGAIKQLDTLNTSIKKVTDSLQGLENVRISFRQVETQLDRFKNRVEEIGLRVGKLGGLDQNTKQTLRQFTAIVKDEFGKMEEIAADDLNKMAAIIGTTGDKINTQFKKFGTNIDGFTKPALDEIQDFSDEVVGDSIIPDMIDKIVAEFQTLPQKTGTEVDKLKTKFIELKEEANDLAQKTGLHDLLDSVQKVKTTQIEHLGDALEDVASKAKKIHDKKEQILFGEQVEFTTDRVREQKVALDDMASTFGMAISEEKQVVTSVESALRRVTDRVIRTTPEFIQMQAEFTRLRSSIRAQDIKGLVDPSDLQKMKELGVAFEDIQENAKKIKLESINEQLKDIQKVGDTTAKGLVGRFTQVRDGLVLAFSKGGSTVLGLRQAMFGLEETTGLVGKAFDFLSQGTADALRTQNLLARGTSDLARQYTKFGQSLRTSSKLLKEAADIEGIDKSEFGQLELQLTKVVKAFKDVQTAAASGGKGTKQAIRAQTEAVSSFRNELELLKARGLIPAGTTAEEIFNDMEKGLDDNARAALNLRARMVGIEKQLDAQKEAQQKVRMEARASLGPIGNMVTTVGKVAGAVGSLAIAAATFGRIRINAQRFGDSIERNVVNIKQQTRGFTQIALSVIGLNSNLEQVNTTLSRITKAFGSFKGILLKIFGVTFLGTLAGNFLSSFLFRIADAIGDFVRLLPGKLITLSSRAEESMAKFSVVFGNSSDTVEGELDKLSDVIGRSALEIKETASGFQDTFVPLGFARDDAAEFSKQLTVLTADVASFNNKLDTDVARDFQSAIVGNHETVRKYGIIITQAALDQELLRLGVEGGVKAANEQEKVLARMNLIFAGSSDAIGDATRTSESWANQLKRLTGFLTDFGVDAGKVLTDSLTPFLQIVNRIARDIGPTLLDTIKSWTQPLVNFGTRVSNTFDAVLDGVVDLSDNASTIIASVISVIKGDWPAAWNLLLLSVDDTVVGIIDKLSGLLDDASSWGFNLVTEIANGIINSASSILTSAMNYVGDIISWYLMPGSPTRFGPLSTIDKWGKGLMTTFASSFDDFNTDFLTKIADDVRSALSDDMLPEAGKLLFTLNTQLRETGTLNEEAFGRLAELLGEDNKALTDSIEASAEYEESRRDLAKIEQELLQAKVKGEDTSEIEERLKAAKTTFKFAQRTAKQKQEELELAKKFKSAGATATGGTLGTETSLEKELTAIKERADLNIISTEQAERERINILRKYAEIARKEGNLEQAKRLAAEALAIEEAAAEATEEAVTATEEKTLDEELAAIKERAKLGIITAEQAERERIGVLRKFAEQARQDGNSERAVNLAAEANNIQKIIDDRAAAEKAAAEAHRKKEAERKKVEREAEKLAAKKTAKEIYRENLTLLDQQLADGVISQEDYARKRLQIEQRFYSDTIKEGKGATDENIANIKKYAAITEALGKKTKASIREFAGVPDDYELPSLIDSVLEGAGVEGIGEAFSTKIGGALSSGVDAAKSSISTKFSELIENLRETVSNKLDEVKQKAKDKLTEIFQPFVDTFNWVKDRIKAFGTGIALLIPVLALLFKFLGPAAAKSTPILGKFGKKLNAIGKVIFPKITAAIRFLVKGITFLVTKGIPLLRSGFSLLLKISKPILTRFGLITTAIAIVIYGIQSNVGLLVEIFDDFVERMKGIFSRVGKVISNIIDIIKGMGDGGVNALTPLGILITGIVEIFKWLWDVLNSVLPNIQQLFAGVFKLVYGIIQATILPSINIITGLLALLTGDTETAKEAFLAAWQGIKDGLSNIVLGILDNFASLLTVIPNALGELVGGFFELIGLGGLGDFLREKIMGTGGAIQTAFAGIGGFIVSLIQGEVSLQSIFEAFGFGAIGETISEIFGESITGITSAFGEVIAVFRDEIIPEFTLIFNQLYSIFSEVWGQIVEVFTKDVWPIISAIIDEISIVLSDLGIDWSILWDILKAAAIVAGVIIGVVIVGLLALIVGVMKGIASALQNAVEAFRRLKAGIEQQILGLLLIFSGFRDLIVGIFTLDMDLAVSGLMDIFSGLIMFFQGLWDTIAGIFQLSIGTILSFVEGLWVGVIDFFQRIYVALIGNSIVPDMITGIIEWFEKLPLEIINTLFNFNTRVVGILDRLREDAETIVITLVKNAIGFFKELWLVVIQELVGFAGTAVVLFNQLRTDVFLSVSQWPQQFYNYAADIITNFAQGIRDNMSIVSNAVQSISDLLPHSPAKTGPLSESVSWWDYIFSDLEKTVVNTRETLNNGLGPLPGDLRSIGFEAGRGMKEGVSESLTTLPSQAGTIGMRTGEAFGTGVSEGMDKIKEAEGKALGFFTGLDAQSEDSVVKLGLSMASNQEQFSGFFDTFGGDADEAFEAIKSGAISIPQDLATFLAVASTDIKGTLATTELAAQDNANILAAVYEGNATSLETTYDNVKTSNVNALGEVQSMLLDTGQTSDEVSAGVEEGFLATGTTVWDHMRLVKDGVGETATKAKDAVSALTDTSIDQMGRFEEMIDRLIGKMEELAIAMSNLSLPGSSTNPNSPGLSLPGFAAGAFDVPRDMAAMIHKGEMILPADIANQIRGGVTNVPGDVATDNSSAIDVGGITVILEKGMTRSDGLEIGMGIGDGLVGKLRSIGAA